MSQSVAIDNGSSSSMPSSAHGDETWFRKRKTHLSHVQSRIWLVFIAIIIVKQTSIASRTVSVQQRSSPNKISTNELLLSLAINSTVVDKQLFCDKRTATWDNQIEESGTLSQSECLLMKITCGVPSCEASIDLVYLWVNGGDPAFVSKKNKTIFRILESEEMKRMYSSDSLKTAGSSNRFRDFNELKYSLRSVERNAPWARRVFLVTDDQIPSFLSPSESLRLRMISHRDLLSYTNLTSATSFPLFNSYAIQSMIHAIPTLSSPFLLLDDDMMFGKHVPRSFLFDSTEERYIMRRQKKPVGRNTHHAYITSVWKSFDLFAELYPNATIVRDVQTEGPFPWHEHGPALMFPEYGFKMWNDFPDAFLKMLKCPFRHPRNLLLQTMYNLYAWDRLKVTLTKPGEFKMIQLKEKNYMRDMAALVNDPPTVVCLNDDLKTEDAGDLEGITRFVHASLDKVFPEKVIV